MNPVLRFQALLMIAHVIRWLCGLVGRRWRALCSLLGFQDDQQRWPARTFTVGYHRYAGLEAKEKIN